MNAPLENKLLIQLEGVKKIYRLGGSDVAALSGVDLEIRTGEVVAIVGPSGSGKSTLLHILGGMDKADAGKTHVAEKDLRSMTPAQMTDFRRHHVGFVFQAFHLIPNLTALENVLLPMEFVSGGFRADAGKARTLLDLVGLGNRLDHRPGQLSGGEQQRVAIARALANGPEIVLADEPTGNLDSASGEQVVNLLCSLGGRHTVVIVTHNERLAQKADRILRLVNGRMVSCED
ncbi:MAG: ABC transporter ATP-binding protein [Nitrospinota bacterium]